MSEVMQVGQLFGTDKEPNPSGGRIYDTGGLMRTLGSGHGMSQPYIAEPVIAAQRGRNPDNPTSRKSGLPTEQMLEIKSDGTTNALTTVQKDNLVIEPRPRIRKLTPRECWRLMGFSDVDFEKAAAVSSNTQLYKQAGNSIVKDVLMAIFGQMTERTHT